jgi:hypothetical protein
MTMVPELRLELQDAAERHASHGASHWPTWSSLSSGRTLLASGGVALCMIVVVAVLLVSATSSTPPAYALTAHADGSYTLRLYTLSRGIPQLNTKLRALGIDETVVPMVQGCPYQVPNYPVNGQETITLRPNHYELAPGDQGFIAASQLPDGSVIYAQGAMPENQIPPCFGTKPVVVIPNPGPTSSRSGSPSGSGGRAHA